MSTALQSFLFFSIIAGIMALTVIINRILNSINNKRVMRRFYAQNHKTDK